MKLKLNKELKLTKASLAKLQENQIGHIKGGVLFSSSGPSCTCRHNTCGGGIEEIADQ